LCYRPGQRENIRFAIRDHPETGAYDRATEAKVREHQREGETRSAQEQAIQRAADTAFADRARMLIKRGYAPKVAVELVLHEMEFEQGNNSRAMEKARAEAEDFLRRTRQGIIWSEFIGPIHVAAALPPSTLPELTELQSAAA